MAGRYPARTPGLPEPPWPAAAVFAESLEGQNHRALTGPALGPGAGAHSHAALDPRGVRTTYSAGQAGAAIARIASPSLS